MYWYNSRTEAIKRANLDGSGVETIVSDVVYVVSLDDLAIDEQNRRIVWVSYVDGVARILSAALDGSDIRYRLTKAGTAQYTAIAIGIKPPWSPADLSD